MNYKKLTIKEIEKLWNIQMVYMIIGTQDNKVINDLAVEVKSRGEMELFNKFQLEVIKCYKN